MLAVDPSDAARETSAAAAAPHQAGIQVAMLTRDNHATAQRIADELGIDTVIPEVLSEDKADQVKRLWAAGHGVAMVGDGVNDSPSLGHADVAVGAGPMSRSRPPTSS